VTLCWRQKEVIVVMSALGVAELSHLTVELVIGDCPCHCSGTALKEAFLWQLPWRTRMKEAVLLFWALEDWCPPSLEQPPA
jgi:hypothetical protein